MSDDILTLQKNLDKYNDDESRICKELLEIKSTDRKVQKLCFVDDVKGLVDSELESLLSKFLINTVIKNKRHIEVCNCLDDFSDILINKRLNVVKKKLLEGRVLTSYEIRRILNDHYDKGVDEVISFCINHNVICKYERDIVVDLVNKFDSKYDFNDPRVFILFNTLVTNILYAHRMGFDSLSEGLVSVHFDKLSNRSISLNPSVEQVRKINSDISSIIEKLDRIMEGSKSVVVNVNEDKVFDRNKMYGYNVEHSSEPDR